MGDRAKLSGYYILPLLASYFNISIDELISYTPQMEQEDIKDLYHRLAEAFSEEPFDEVMMECREIIKNIILVFHYYFKWDYFY